MIQISEQTDSEKMEMYLKCTKKELASMLIQCNKRLEALRKPDVMQSFCDIGYYPDQSSGAEGMCVNCGRLENEH